MSAVKKAKGQEIEPVNQGATVVPFPGNPKGKSADVISELVRRMNDAGKEIAYRLRATQLLGQAVIDGKAIDEKAGTDISDRVLEAIEGVKNDPALGTVAGYVCERVKTWRAHLAAHPAAHGGLRAG